MSKQLAYRHDLTGVTLYAVLRRDAPDNRVWNTASANWEALTVANWADYDIALAETPASSFFYSGTLPAIAGNMAAGWLWVDIYERTGAAPAIGDFYAAAMFGYWDGTQFLLRDPNTGDAFARLGAPAGASVSADLAAVKTDTGNLVTRITSTLFSGITSLGNWLRCLARKDAANSTAKTELNTGGGEYNEATDSLEGIRDTAPLGTAMRGTDGAHLSGAAVASVTGDVGGKVLGGGSGAITGVGVVGSDTPGTTTLLALIEDFYQVTGTPDLSPDCTIADIGEPAGTHEGGHYYRWLVDGEEWYLYTPTGSGSGFLAISQTLGAPIHGEPFGADGWQSSSLTPPANYAPVTFIGTVTVVRMRRFRDGTITDSHGTTTLLERLSPEWAAAVVAAAVILDDLTEDSDGLRFTAKALEECVDLITTAEDLAPLVSPLMWNYASRTLTTPAVQLAAAVLDGLQITMLRGDSFSADITGLGSLAEAVDIWFTVKPNISARPDESATVQISLVNGLLRLVGNVADATLGTLTVLDALAGNLRITIQPAATAALPLMIDGQWDIQMLTAAGAVRTLTTGTFIVVPDVTRRIS